MNTLPVLYHLVRADFLERVRRVSFLVVLAATVFAGYLFVPPVDAGYRVLQVGAQRGIYNSAWIGLMFGLIAAMHLPLVGFYLVKNAVERDRRTGVGQIIASTPLSKLVYVAGKWLSNLAVLMLILGILTVMAVVMQLVRAEAATVDLWALVVPIWLMGLPVLAIAAALAVLCECIPLLRGSLGSVAFFLIWLGTMVVVLSGATAEPTGLIRPANDPYGFTRSMADIQDQVLAADPGASVGSGLINTAGEIDGTFFWGGPGWKPGAILARALWAGLAVVIALAAAIPFDRFDPARGRTRSRREGLLARLSKRVEVLRGGSPRPEPIEAAGSQRVALARLTPLTVKTDRVRFFGVLLAELKLMVKGRSWLWWAGALGLNIACLVNPEDVVQRTLCLVVWIWPLAAWLQMGVRERRHNTWQVVFSVPQPALRLLPALWLAGVLFTGLAGCGAWLRLALTGDVAGLLAWLAGALFAPALALALGVWAGNSRAFEAIYLLWWYLGPANRVPAFDFTGTSAEGPSMGMPFVYLAITAGLVGLALLGRWRQMRS